MIKINLLPYQIIERRRVRSLMKVLGVVVLAEVVALGFWVLQLNGQVTRAEKEWKDAKMVADQKRAVDQEVTALEGQIGAVNKWVIWSNQVAGVAPKYAALLEFMNQYIPREVIVQRMTIANPNMVIVGATNNMSVVAKYYRSLVSNPAVATVTMATQVPTWTPQGGASGPAVGPMAIPVTMNLVFKAGTAWLPPATSNPPTTSISGGEAGAIAAGTGGPPPEDDQ